MEKIKTGAQCRNATTDEFLEIAENISHKKLDWFWEVYFRTSSLPKLHYKKVNKENIFWWETENNLSFNLPIEIKADNKIFTIEMQNNKAMFNFAGEIEIDPEEKILKELIKE